MEQNIFDRSLDVVRDWLSDSDVEVTIVLKSGQTFKCDGKSFLEYNEYGETEDEVGFNTGKELLTTELGEVQAIHIKGD